MPPTYPWTTRREIPHTKVVEARIGPPMLAPGEAPTVCLHVSGDLDRPGDWHWSATLSNLLLIADGDAPTAPTEADARAAARKAAADWLRDTLSALEAL